MIGLALVGTIVAFAVAVLSSWQHRVRMCRLGTVSQQWLAEHRAK